MDRAASAALSGQHDCARGCTRCVDGESYRLKRHKRPLHSAWQRLPLRGRKHAGSQRSVRCCYSPPRTPVAWPICLWLRVAAPLTARTRARAARRAAHSQAPCPALSPLP